MKLCKDCKYFQPDTAEWEGTKYAEKHAICVLSSRVTLFDGEPCSERRKEIKWFGPYCGPKGLQWEAK